MASCRRCAMVRGGWRAGRGGDKRRCHGRGRVANRRAAVGSKVQRHGREQLARRRAAGGAGTGGAVARDRLCLGVVSLHAAGGVKGCRRDGGRAAVMRRPDSYIPDANRRVRHGERGSGVNELGT